MGEPEPTPAPDPGSGPIEQPAAVEQRGPVEQVGHTVEQVGHTVEQVGHTVGRAVEDIGGYIRAQRESAQVSMRQLARLAGISNPYLSQVERGLRKPSAEILGQIAKGLRISAEVLYVQAGILEEQRGDSIVAAVSADPALNERQKQALLEIYHSFRRENGQSGAARANEQGGPASRA
jgi:transcriptional regulator with XRE-family HTH domain